MFHENYISFYSVYGQIYDFALGWDSGLYLTVYPLLSLFGYIIITAQGRRIEKNPDNVQKLKGFFFYKMIKETNSARA